ncbi:MAG: energy-coupling factor ABC transporter substrate-binding protein [Methanothrix sp.]|nr:energy-coupling factor ABC transporter substrate-binding protein [Methanothrix sp.]
MKLEYITISVLVLFIAAFAYTSSTGNHEWSGADDKPEAVIDDLTGGSYQPWAESIWTPPSGEIESLLFALQAAFGSIIIGYFLGYYRGLAKAKAAASYEGQEGNLNARSAR